MNNNGNDAAVFRDTVITSSLWVILQHASVLLLELAKIIVLARLIGPADFGVFGVTLLMIAVFDTFTSPALGQALIQSKGEIRAFYDTVWSAEVLRGIAVALLLYALAPWISRVFASTLIEMPLKAISAALILQGLTNVSVVCLEKELRFDKYFMYNLSGAVSNAAVSVGCAFLFRNVWALVCGFLAEQAVRCAVSYRIDAYRPRLNFDVQKLKTLFSFGKWVLASNTLILIINRIDALVVGKILGVTSLGFYQMAHKSVSVPTVESGRIVSRVSFPVYSQLQADTGRLLETYLKVLQALSIVIIPVVAFGLIWLNDLVRIILGEKWIVIVPVASILLISGGVRSLVATTGPLLKAVGHPRKDTLWQLFRLLIVAAAIVPFINRWGIKGAAWAVLLSISVSGMGFFFNAMKVLNGKLSSIFTVLAAPLLGVLPPFGFLYYIKMNGAMSAAASALYFTGAALAYCVLVFLSDRVLGGRCARTVQIGYNYLRGAAGAR